MEEVTVKSYNGKMVKIPSEKKEEYLRNQEKVKKYIKDGKTQKEILKLLKNNDCVN